MTFLWWAELGDSLRAVSTYHEDEYELVYERADVSTKPRAIDRIHQELIMEGRGTESLEDALDVGQLNCTLHCFEEAMFLHFVRGPMRGVFVAIDPDAMVFMERFIETCTQSSVDSPQ